MIREFFGFRKMIAGRLIKIIYLLGAFAVTIFGFVLMFAPVLFRDGVYFPGGGRPVEIYIARIIHHDLTLANAKSWQWRTSISQVYDRIIYLNKRYKPTSDRQK